ncbi:MAG: hypothetical protein WCP39_03960 [Chlamydiota bacterium]
MKKFLFLCFWVSLGFGQNCEEFTPWYTGPVLAPEPTCMEAGKVQVQPYIVVKDAYGEYNNHWKNKSISSIFSLEPVLLLRTSITNFFDVTFWSKAIFQKQRGHGVFRYEDTPVRLGFQLTDDSKGSTFPALRFTISECFPTGKYQRLSPSKAQIDSSGDGAYRTELSVILSKTVYWIFCHPIRWIIYLTGTIPSHVKVHGFHYYGGGYGTHGTIKPYYGVLQGASMEYSITQKWVFALEYLYEYKSKSTFSGESGHTALGIEATNGTKLFHRWSLGPLIEYNFTSEFGIIGEIAFSIFGKNAPSYVSGTLSLVYIW